MNRRHSIYTGIALLLGAGFLVALLACTVLFPPGVGAHPCPPGEEGHEDFHGVTCSEDGHDEPHREVIEVDANRDQELVFMAYPHGDDEGPEHLGTRDRIEITLSDFDLSGADFSSVEGRAKILIYGSLDVLPGEDEPQRLPPSEVMITEENKLVLTISGQHNHSKGETFTVIIEEGTGIRTPKTPRGFDDPDEGYFVEMAFVDTELGTREVSEDENIVVVRNPVSSSVPGAAVRVELAANAEAALHATDEIQADFSGPTSNTSFTVPDSVDESKVQIRYGTGGSEKTFKPSEVLVDGRRVVLTLPRVDDPGVADGAIAIPSGEYIIIFNQSAGIKNPLSAGNRTIVVSSLVPHDEDDEIIAVIKRTTGIDPPDGIRGSDFTLVGKGYAEGTVTVFDGDDEHIDPGETLASVETVNGAFELTPKARRGEGGDVYRVWTKDSYGVVDSVDFVIRSSLSFEYDSVGVGSLLTITASDLGTAHPGIAAVRIAGETAYVTAVTEYENCFHHGGLHRADSDRKVAMEVTVPEGVPPGRQTVSVYGPGELEHLDEDSQIITGKGPCSDLQEDEAKGRAVAASRVRARLRGEPAPITTRTISIGAHTLALSPETAVGGQRITIAGSGFITAGGREVGIRRITIGGKDVEEDPSRFVISPNGDVVLAVTVPAGVAAGSNEVLVQGAGSGVGLGSLTVPEAAITLNPEQGRRGEQAEVTGRGFMANGLVTLVYGDGGDLGRGDAYAGSVIADAKGDFDLNFTVPLDAQTGRRYKVTAVAETAVGGATVTMSAAADHSTPGSVITVTPQSALPGDFLIIRGEHFPPFALVRPVHIGGLEVTPSPMTATGENGSFETKVRIPQLELGEQTVQVEVSGVVAGRAIEVTGPPLSGRPQDVFNELIRAGVLVRIWMLRAETQRWFFYDPHPELKEFSNLEDVKSGDIVVVNLTQPHHFQGDELRSGWNHIQLD